MLRAWLHSQFPSGLDVDDIVQEAYLRVFGARERVQMRSPKSFLFATARNLALDHFASHRVSRTKSLGSLEELAVLDDTDVFQIAATNQEIELMTQAIQSLPERCRQVLTLRNVYGMPHKQIAEQLGMSVRTVETHARDGLKLCTRFIRQQRAQLGGSHGPARP